MHKILIVGVGTDENDITLSGINAIKQASKVVVRTSLAKSYGGILKLNSNVVSLDFVYEKSRNFDTLNKNLAKQVKILAEEEDIVYAVDGCALEDESVKQLLKSVDAQVIAGVSAGAKCLERLKISESSYTLASCYDVALDCPISFPLIVYAVDGRQMASLLKLKLADVVGDEKECFVSSLKGSKKIKIFELDRLEEYDYSTCVYVKKEHFLHKDRFDTKDLKNILIALRAENGCPWDRAQTQKSIEKNLIEESYELIDAIEKGDEENIIEEIGDVILQAYFHLLFGEEQARYTEADVLTGLCKKLIMRHSHVFGTDTATDSASALDTWNKNKTVEKGYKNGGDYLNGVPKNFPSLMFAQKVGSRAKKYNFDFNGYEDALLKVVEEINEFKDAINSKNKEQIEGESGDLLFSVVNAVRLAGVDAELCLKKSTEKFINRFKKLEELILSDGKDMKTMSAKEIDEYYLKVKEIE